MPGLPAVDFVALRKAREALAADKEIARLEPTPEPEVHGREVIDSDVVPRNATSLVKAAGKAGFVTRTTYARGPYLNANGTVNRIADSIGVRGEHPDGRWFVGTWVTGPGEDAGYSFESGHVSDKTWIVAWGVLRDFAKG